MSPQDVWNPAQYEKFKKQRSQPFFDLLELLQPAEQGRVVDLGCGTGELTAMLHHHLKARETIGIDSSAEMLSKAKTLATPGLTFETRAIENWEDEKGFNFIFSNAALQWCGDHPRIFRRLRDNLRADGQLAVQMPMNHDYPTHLIAEHLSGSPPWLALLKNEKYEKQKWMLSMEEYSTLLFKLGFKEQKVFTRVYGHVLDSREDVIEWVKGTLLTYFQSRLNEADYRRFLAEFKEKLFQQIPDEKPFFYPFKRIFIWAKI